MSTTPTTSSRKPHLGRNIERLRDLRGIKQDALAKALGISQQAVSRMEQSEEVEEERLLEVAQVLGVTPEAIQNFSEEAAINYFNTFNDNSISHVIGNYGTYHYNPIEKLIEVMEENKRLYERLLKEKDATIEKLEQQSNGKP